MRVITGDYRSWEPMPQPTAVTIGVYDGVHLGHQRVLETLRQSGLPVVVVTFRDHPMTTIDPDRAPQLLTTTEQRLELFAGHGVAAVALIDFDDDFRRLPAEEFVEKIVVATLRARRVAVGQGFRFGHEQLGDVTLLREMGAQYGFIAEDIDILEAGVPVRSTVIRALLKEGDVAAARRMLGRPFCLEGTVVPGDQRGRTIGVPTANLRTNPLVVTPGSGVYAVRLEWDDETYDGVVNVGRRPTFGGSEYVVEAHAIDFSGDLYGKTIAVSFIKRLRAEQKFSGVAALVAAIHADIIAAKEILERS